MSDTPEAIMQVPVDASTIQETHYGRTRRLVAGATLVTIGLIGVACGDSEPKVADSVITTTTTTVPETTTTLEVCAETWVMPGVDHGENHRWFKDGIKEIKNAKNDEQAEAAADAWLHGNDKHPGVKHDNELLATVYNSLVYPAKKKLDPELRPVKPEELKDTFDPENCATHKAYTVLTELEITLSKADIHPAIAPADGYNTGTDAKGKTTVADKQGVWGNDESRKAISITTEDGCTLFVMERCGQIVMTKICSPEVIPQGPTEVAPKFDDGILPGDGTEASQDRGTPDVAGEGPAGQQAEDDGYLPSETTPVTPSTNASHPTTPTTHDGTTPTTGTQVTASSAPPTSGSVPPNRGTTPTTPGI